MPVASSEIVERLFDGVDNVLKAAVIHDLLLQAMVNHEKRTKESLVFVCSVDTFLDSSEGTGERAERIKQTLIELKAVAESVDVMAFCLVNKTSGAIIYPDGADLFFEKRMTDSGVFSYRVFVKNYDLSSYDLLLQNSDGRVQLIGDAFPGGIGNLEEIGMDEEITLKRDLYFNILSSLMLDYQEYQPNPNDARGNREYLLRIVTPMERVLGELIVFHEKCLSDEKAEFLNLKLVVDAKKALEEAKKKLDSYDK